MIASYTAIFWTTKKVSTLLKAFKRISTHYLPGAVKCKCPSILKNASVSTWVTKISNILLPPENLQYCIQNSLHLLYS